MEEKYLAVFASYTDTSILNKKLEEANIYSQIIATPSKLSVGCSRTVKFNATDYNRVVQIISESSLTCRGIFGKVYYKGYLTYVIIWNVNKGKKSCILIKGIYKTFYLLY